MAEASPGTRSSGSSSELTLKIRLTFSPNEKGTKRQSLYSSDQRIQNTRDSAITVFTRHDLLQDTVQKIRSLRSITVSHIIAEGKDGILFECQINDGKELKTLKDAVCDGTLKTQVTQLVENEVPAFNWQLYLDVDTDETKDDERKLLSGPSSECVAAGTFEQASMKQTMAQAHVEPLVINLNATYSLQALESASDVIAVKQKLFHELQNLNALDKHLKEKDEFQNIRIDEITSDSEKENTFIVRITTYNREEVDNVIALVTSNRLSKEFENYISVSMVGVKHIRVSINISVEEVKQWKSFFIPRSEKSLPSISQKPPLKRKPAGDKQAQRKLTNMYAVIQKKFCVFVPSDQLTNVSSVRIQTVQCSSSLADKINNKDLKPHNTIKGLWMLCILLPSNVKINLKYKYLLTGSKGNENVLRQCTDMRTERDIFNNPDNMEDGVLGHFTHILQDADNTDINASFNEVNNLAAVDKLSNVSKDKVMGKLLKTATERSTPIKSLCFIGMINVLKTSKLVYGFACRVLLKGISDNKLLDMDKSLKKSIQDVVVRICLSLPDSSYVHLITYMYPFFDERSMADIFNSLEKYKIPKSSDTLWESHSKFDWEERVITCVNVICNRAIHNQSEGCMKLIEIILSCLPAQQTLMCVNQILFKFQEHTSFHEDIEKLIRTVREKYKTQLVCFAAKRDAGSIVRMWKDMDKRSRHSLMALVEDNLLFCFDNEFLIRNASANCTSLLSICKCFDGIFRDKEHQYKLLALLHRSKFDKCLDLFQQLIELPGFCGGDTQSNYTAFVCGWYETTLENIKTSGGSDTTKIKMMYEKLGSIVENAEIVHVDLKVQDVLSNMTYSMMKNDIHVDAAISIMGYLWNTAKAEEIFFIHLRKLIYDQHSALAKLQTKIFKEKQEALEVNKCGMAKLIVTLMDIEGSPLGKLNSEDGVRAMVSNGKFWISAMTVQGRAMNVVTNSAIFQLAQQTLFDFRMLLLEKRFSKRTFDRFVDSEDELFYMYRRMFPAVDRLEALWRSSKLALERNLKMLNETADYVKEIEKLKYYAGDRFSKTCQIVRKYLKNTADELLAGDIHLADVLKFDIFRKDCDTDFHTNAAWLSRVATSDLFININRYILKSFLSARSLVTCYDDEKGDSFHIRLLQVFVATLFSEGQKNYRDIWTPFVEGKDLEVKTVLKCFCSASGYHEIHLAKKMLTENLNVDMENALLNLLTYKQYRHKIHLIKSALDTFEIDQTHQSEFMKSFESCLVISKLTLLDVSGKLKYLYDIADTVDDDMKVTLSVLRQTDKSIELIHFLRKVIDEDMSILVDSVEDYSDQNVSLSTVSSLVDVQSFIKPLLRCTPDEEVTSFLSKFKDTFTSNKMQNMDSKFLDCLENVHSIKYLYDNMANREEKTREIISNIIDRGIFHFTLKDGICSIEVTYYSNTRVTHTASKLSDLKSQALLIMNTEKKERLLRLSKRIKSCDFQYFISIVDQAFGIYELCSDLHLSGHYQYQSFQEETNCEGLYDILERLYSDYSEWEELLYQSRKDYTYMNYIYGLQIQRLYDFFILLKSDRNVLPILQFISPKVSAKEMEKIFKVESANQRSTLPTKAKALQIIAEKIKQICELVPPLTNKFPIERRNFKVNDCVQKGRFYVARLQTGSDLVTRVMLSLYLNTTSKIPNSNQVIFCDNNTQWDELYLLLRRCQNRNERNDNLFCIAFVELLSTELKTHLAIELQSMQNNSSILLALIIRCDSDNPFLNRFPDNVMNPEPLSDPQMRTCLQSTCPFVKVFTSDHTGLGKTEAVREEASQNNKRLISFHISGPFSKQKLVQRLLSLYLSKAVLLHIDIGPTNDAVDLDLFLFQLLFLGIVSAGTTLYKLQTEYISIELANTFDGSLEREMTHVALFQEQENHLTWKGFSNYKISSERTSNIQAVCQYLKYLKQNNLDLIDIYFTGPKIYNSLSRNICQNLLASCFKSNTGLTFPQINVFVSVLAQQLKRLSMSNFFRTKTLASGVLPRNTDINVKSTLVRELIEISKTFAIKSIKSTKKSQMIAVQKMMSIDKSSDEMPDADHIEEVHGIIKWEDSNHFILLFQNKDKETVSALYRDLKNVPCNIIHLLEIQSKKKLVNFDDMDPQEQQQLVIGITRSRNNPIDTKITKTLSDSYVLTTDNILKMILIWLRIQVAIPVVVMGETGCGKTSLVTYLSKICGSKLKIVNVHAGVDDTEITSIVQDVNVEAFENLSIPIWMFFDEINTTDCIGLLADIICHRKLNGKDLAPNLVLLAACNPYKLRNPQSITTPGLQGKLKSDKLCRLVYRVHPLPETLIEYIWDFGMLPAEDERKYVTKIVQTSGEVISDHVKQELFITLISESQRFVRAEESPYSVSLRDVNRCQRLYQWFKITFLELKNADDQSYDKSVKAMILSLAHCYFCRFQSTKVRQKYLDRVSEIFFQHGFDYSKDDIEDIIMTEQTEILAKMELPEGTARNTALQENVFMILVSALNRIPLFIVGKPGCSKSLSIQLIKSNLRGKDSKNDLFRKMPRVICIVFQGSESSTSDGIIKVFERAKGLQSRENVLPLVILDEIGLAEVSQFNPLKVLHSLLEPVDKDIPDIAVVGISNWALDAAKMNRAIHLCRPDMDYHDVHKTGLSIVESFNIHDTDTEENEKSRLVLTELKKQALESITKAYTEYIHRQAFQNFHGLRDYYSLIKFLSKSWFCKNNISDADVPDILNLGICRNFGGRKSELQLAKQVFKERLKGCIAMEGKADIPVYELIEKNIVDTNSRHLMLISKGDALINILVQFLDAIGREYVTIVGSKFEDDQTDDYNYRILSQIILCMEQGKVLILKDLDNIYGSLYDMLNQNYTEFARQKYCRVALGEYSSPMCYVEDKFKCIVLVEESDLQKADPPFLNRFEKQQFSFVDLLPMELTEPERNLESLFTQLSHNQQVKDSAFMKIVFPIARNDMLITLLLQQTSKYTDLSIEELEELCLLKLLHLCTPESLLQFESELSESHPVPTRNILSTFLKLPVHNGLSYYLAHDINDHSFNAACKKEQRKKVGESNKIKQEMENGENIEESQTNKSSNSTMLDISKQNESHTSDDISNKPVLTISVDQMFGKLMVFTHSNIHCNIQLELDSADVVRISQFRSKKSIEKAIADFMKLEKHNFVIHFDLRHDFQHILLVKTIIDIYMNPCQIKDHALHRRFIIILHLPRRSKLEIDLGQKLNFLSGWDFVYLDTIEKPKTSLTKIIGKNIRDVILNSKEELPEKIKKGLFWAFTRINYAMSKLRKVQELNRTVENIQNIPELLELFGQRICNWLSPDDTSFNIVEKTVSDLHALCRSSSLISAIFASIDDYIASQLAKMVFVLEELGVFDCITDKDEKKIKWKMWKEFCENEKIVSIKDVPVPEGPCCYIVRRTISGLKTPFVMHFLQQVESLKQDFLLKTQLFMEENGMDTPDQLTVPDMNDLMNMVKTNISVKIAELSRWKIVHQREDYIHDFFLYVSRLYSCSLDTESKLKVIRWIFSRFCSFPETLEETVVVLHITFWLYNVQILAVLRLIDIAVNTLSDSLSFLLDEKPVIKLRQDERTISVFSTLIDYIFRLMVPSSKALKIMSVPVWQRKVNGLFCLSDLIGIDAPVEHILRFCHDLTVIFVLPCSLDRRVLQAIGDTLSHDDSCLESYTTFETLVSTLRKVREKQEHVSAEKLQRTLCMYVNRCFASDPHQAITMTVLLLNKILEENYFDTRLTSFGPTLGLAIRELHANTNDSVFVSLISCTVESYRNQILRNCELFRIIDKCFKNDKIGMPLAGIISDLLQRDIYSEPFDENSQSKPIYIAKDTSMELLLAASDVLYSDSGTDMRQIAALSFCRTYISKFIDNLNLLDTREKKKVCEAVNSVLSKHKSSNYNGIVMYFLRCVERENGIIPFRKICCSLADEIGICKTYANANTESDLDMYPLIPHIAHIFSKFKDTLESQDVVKLQNIIARFNSKREILLCSLALLHFNYLRRVNPGIGGDISKSMIDKAVHIAKSILTDINRKGAIPFVDFLAGHSALRISALEVTSRPDDFHLLSVITQFICLVISNCSKDNNWIQLIHNPDELIGNYLPFEKGSLRIQTNASAVTCSICSHRVLSKFNECPVCETPMDFNYVKDEVKDVKRNCGISSILTDFLISSCLLAALGVGNEETSVRKVLEISEDNHTELFLDSRIERQWKRLKVFFGTGDSGLCHLFQLIFVEALHLFKSDCRMLQKDEWDQFKSQFSSEISRIILNKIKNMKNIYVKFNQALEINIENCLEAQLNFPATLDKTDLEKSRSQALYMKFVRPSPENLYTFMSIRSMHRKMPLLQLVLENLEWMSLPRLLPSLVSWHAILIKCAQFQLRTDDIQSMRVSQFLEKFSGEKQKILTNKYSMLTKSLNILKRFASYLGEMNVSLSRLHLLEDDPLLENCVILGRRSLLYQIVEAIAHIQNRFLDKVLELSCSDFGCPATSFLLKKSNAAVIQTVDVINITNKDVINFDFDSALLYSQCSARMSDHNVIYYDCYNIQLEIAYDLHGKAFINVPKNIPSVDFADGLYQNSVLMLEAIKDQCEQKPLPEMTEKYLKKACDVNPPLCQNLLKMTEILLALMQSTNTDPSVSMSDFIDDWKSTIPEGSLYDVLLSAECQLNLHNLVPLYKFLEETNGGMLIDSISQYYRIDIEEDDKQFLTNQSKNNFHMMRHVFKAMKVILHRRTFLRQSSSEQVCTARQQRISDQLGETSYWCDGCEHCRNDENYIENSIKCIPEKLVMKQFQSVIVFIKEKIEIERDINETAKYTTNRDGKQPLSQKKKRLDTLLKKGNQQRLLDFGD